MTIKPEEAFHNIHMTGGMPIIPAGAMNAGTVNISGLAIGTKVSVTTDSRAKYELTVVENGCVDFVRYEWEYGDYIYSYPDQARLLQREPDLVAFMVKEISARNPMSIIGVTTSGDEKWNTATSRVAFWVIDPA